MSHDPATPRKNLLFVADPLPFPSSFPLDAFFSSLAARWDLLVLSTDKPGFSLPAGATFSVIKENAFAEEARRVFSTKPLEAVIFLGADAVKRRFFPVRQVAGRDQTLVCFFPETHALHRLPRGGDGLSQKRRWREILSEADGLWAARPTDRDRILRTIDPRLDVEVLPPAREAPALRDWAGQRLEILSADTAAKNAYGTPADLTSIVLLTHNDGDYLKQCLARLRRHTRGPYEIIVVDNATTDGSSAFLEKEKDVRLIRSPKNLFFSGGNNLGLRAARGNHLLLLNADTAVTPHWLERLVLRAKRDKTAGLLGPYTNRAAGQQGVQKPGYSSLRALDAFSTRWARRHEGGRLEVPRLDGFCLLIKREVMKAIGLLDERFGPGGYEDYDYCLRARQAGYKLLLVEDAFVHHHGGKGYRDQDYDAARERNRGLFVEKWCQQSLAFLDEVW
ncbi:MAG TPA: glycosyltransferase family 2 protein [Elusimicrobiota bacterium]|nr:glycosyltransferase family 2 protein [Elusimicrobiota bacterium]